MPRPAARGGAGHVRPRARSGRAGASERRKGEQRGRKSRPPRGKVRQRIDGREKIGYNSKKSLPPFGAEGGEIAWVRKRPCLRQRKRRSLPPCTAAGGGCSSSTISCRGSPCSRRRPRSCCISSRTSTGWTSPSTTSSSARWRSPCSTCRPCSSASCAVTSRPSSRSRCISSPLRTSCWARSSAPTTTSSYMTRSCTRRAASSSRCSPFPSSG